MGKGTEKTKPTAMGDRIIELMVANAMSNKAHLAETIGISRQRLHAWLYTPLRDVEARPLLRCADALNTNPDYILGDSDDPRPMRALAFREHQLVAAFRDLSPTDQDRLLATATAWVGEADSAPSTSAPFRGVPMLPPAK